MRLDVKRTAWSDLQDIAEYITRDNPDRAESFVDELIAKIESIGENPLRHPARMDGQDGLRAALHGAYLILYRVEDDVVTVLRVAHGARDIGALF